MTIAKIGTAVHATLAAAALAIKDGETVNITRNGAGAEATAAFTKAGKFKILGVKDAKGALPLLKLDLYTRPAFGKAIINLEDGYYEIANLHMDGCAVPESNGAAIRMNPGTDILNVHHVRLTNNENGILTAATETGELHLSDSVLDKNSQSTSSDRQGYSHNIYVGAIKRFTATRVSFTNARYGHDLKTRALETILDQVLCEGAAKGRALDVANGGIVVATDCRFVKPASAGQNNLIDIGAEGIPAGRVERYEFRNCEFFNDVGILRDVQYILNRSTKAEVVLIDPLFTGAAAEKSQKNTLVGKIRIELTGGPLGPRKPAGGDPGAVSTAPIPEPTLPVTPAPTPTPEPTPAPSGPSFEIVGDPGDGTWTKIGKEADTITVQANTVVRYGANGQYVFAKASGAFKADNTTFKRDPISGTAKIVESFAPKAGTQPAPTPTPATGDWRDLLDKMLGDPTIETAVSITIKPIKK